MLLGTILTCPGSFSLHLFSGYSLSSLWQILFYFLLNRLSERRCLSFACHLISDAPNSLIFHYAHVIFNLKTDICQNINNPFAGHSQLFR
jgi:hypothetical protein